VGVLALSKIMPLVWCRPRTLLDEALDTPAPGAPKHRSQGGATAVTPARCTRGTWTKRHDARPREKQACRSTDVDREDSCAYERGDDFCVED
jgi:hypothetical protein